MKSKETELERLNHGLMVHNNQHGYRGVFYDSKRDRFCAEIWPKGVRHRLGRFLTAGEAAQAYDHAARHHYGKEAFLNFPGPDERSVVACQTPELKCAHGHEMHRRDDGKAVCRECNRLAASRYYERKRLQR